MTDRGQPDPSPEHLLIATLAPQDATTTLFFSELTDSVPLRFAHYSVDDISRPLPALRAANTVSAQLAGASAVIFVRGLFEFGNLVECARWLGVPRYYFLDDNLMILTEQPELYDPKLGRRYSHDHVRRLLRDFRGVLLATPSLVEYFREHRLHDNLVLYPPMAGLQTVERSRASAGELSVAFFGGMHRRDAFLRYVYPAACRLALERKVTLYAAGIDVAGMTPPAQLRIVPVEYRSSYPQALQEMADRGIDILAHPSSVTGNNRFKNPHFIINARALGATPVFSNAPPYDALAGEDVAVLCENTEEAWYEAMHRVAVDPSLRARISRRIAGYCDTHFNATSNRRILQDLLRRHPPPSPLVAAGRRVAGAAILAAGLAQELSLRQFKRFA